MLRGITDTWKVITNKKITKYNHGMLKVHQLELIAH